MMRQTLLIGFGLAAAACSASPRSPVPLDCHQGDGYEFNVVESYEPGSISATPQWYSYGDSTPDASHTMQVGSGIPPEPIPDGRCGSTFALVLRSQGHTDYGSGFGMFEYSGSPNNTYQGNDESAWEGVSFWARSPGETDKAFTFNLNDRTSSTDPDNARLDANGAEITYDDGGTEHYCYVPPATAAAGQICTVDPTTNQPNCGIPGTDVRHDQCGNPFTTVVMTTTDWHLYLLPWSALQQKADSRRQAHGIDTTSVWGVTIAFPKEARAELWFDDYGFYRKARGGSATD
jgi:hypothetical protein